MNIEVPIPFFKSCVISLPSALCYDFDVIKVLFVVGCGLDL